MNMRMDPLHVTEPQTTVLTDGPDGARCIVLATESSAHAFWLASALGDEAQVIPVGLEMAQLQPLVTGDGLGVVVVDFSAPSTDEAVALVAVLRAQCPGVILVGAGKAAEPASMLAALRSGVAEFVDWDAGAAEASALLRRQLLGRGPLAVKPVVPAVNTQAHFSLPILGARVGMGVTTLAVHLAVMLQEMQAHDARGASRKAGKTGVGDQAHAGDRHSALLDLGLPARDGLLYLNIAGNFSFVDAIQNVRRLDSTLVDSAFEKHDTGTAAIAWPADLSKLRDVPPNAAADVVKALRGFFKAQVIDLGGMAQVEFLLPLLRESQQAWVVCDQSMGGIVSTAHLIQELESRGIDRSKLKLVVNRFNAQAGLSAKEIAQRLGIELIHVVPDRATALLNAASCGQLLSQSLRGDPFVASIRSMSRSLLGNQQAVDVAAPAASGIFAQWAKRLRRGA